MLDVNSVELSNISATGITLWLVYGIYLSQVVLLSFYASIRWRDYREAIFSDHPQSEYPRLYVQPLNVEMRRLHIRRILDYLIGLFGIFLLCMALITSMNLQKLSEYLLFYSMVQLIPYSLSSYWGRKNSQLLSESQMPQVRTTSLTPRTINHFVSPKYLTLSLIIFLATQIFGLSVYFTDLWPSESWRLLSLLLLNALMLAFLASRIIKSLFGKRSDYYLANDDRINQMHKTIRHLMRFLVLYNLFIASLIVIKLLTHDIIPVYLLTSICFQVVLLTLVKTNRMQNFNAYRT